MKVTAQPGDRGAEGGGGELILRREETAATRSMAQTAKALAENALLVRLKELEAYTDLAGRSGS